MDRKVPRWWVLALALSAAAAPACDDVSCRGHEARDGTLLRTHVQGALATDPEVPADDVDFEVEGDRVILSGEVETPRERDAALRAVRAVPGVSSVVDEMEVSSEAEAK